MSDQSKLLLVKLVHTVIWLFFNVVIFYFLYSVITNSIDSLTWWSVGFIAAEVVILAIFKTTCPITLIARNYSDSTQANFDIFLPNWLAKYNKIIYSIIVTIGFLILAYRLY